MYYCRFETQFCDITVAGDDMGICRLYFHSADNQRTLEHDAHWQRNDDFFHQAVEQIQAYARGERQNFSLKLNPQGTDFQQSVWQALRQIPFGQLRSYKDIAIAINNPKAARAVGMANHHNPISLLIPCHRVIASNGHLGGFAAGLNLKQSLLHWEQACINKES